MGAGRGSSGYESVIPDHDFRVHLQGCWSIALIHGMLYTLALILRVKAPEGRDDCKRFVSFNFESLTSGEG